MVQSKMKIKICGITNKDDAINAVSLGADALGFIFYKQSPRYIAPSIVEEITHYLPPYVSIVGVFVNEEKTQIQRITNQCKLDIIQLHGNESPADCINLNKRTTKAFSIKDQDDLNPIANYQGMISGMLLDTKAEDIKGGTGQTFDWGLAIRAKEYDIPLILAGGIKSENIKKAIQLVNPYGIDVSSGVESEPGKKDYNKMKELISEAKNV